MLSAKNHATPKTSVKKTLRKDSKKTPTATTSIFNGAEDQKDPAIELEYKSLASEYLKLKYEVKSKDNSTPYIPKVNIKSHKAIKPANPTPQQSSINKKTLKPSQISYPQKNTESSPKIIKKKNPQIKNETKTKVESIVSKSPFSKQTLNRASVSNFNKSDANFAKTKAKAKKDIKEMTIGNGNSNGNNPTKQAPPIKESKSPAIMVRPKKSRINTSSIDNVIISVVVDGTNGALSDRKRMFNSTLKNDKYNFKAITNDKILNQSKSPVRKSFQANSKIIQEKPNVVVKKFSPPKHTREIKPVGVTKPATPNVSSKANKRLMSGYTRPNTSQPRTHTSNHAVTMDKKVVPQKPNGNKKDSKIVIQNKHHEKPVIPKKKHHNRFVLASNYNGLITVNSLENGKQTKHWKNAICRPYDDLSNITNFASIEDRHLYLCQMNCQFTKYILPTLKTKESFQPNIPEYLTNKDISSWSNRSFQIHQNDIWLVKNPTVRGDRWGITGVTNKQIRYSMEYKKIVKSYESEQLTQYQSRHLCYDLIAADAKNLFVTFMSYNPMICGSSEKEEGEGYQKQINIKTGRMVKDYGKISNQRINSMIISGDNLFTGSDDGYLLNFSIEKQAIIKDFGFVTEHSIESLACNTNRLFVYDLLTDQKEYCISTKKLVVNWGCLHKGRYCYDWCTNKNDSFGAQIACDDVYLTSSDRQGVLKLWNIKRKVNVHTFKRGKGCENQRQKEIHDNTRGTCAKYIGHRRYAESVNFIAMF